jgi:hypothetical protein
MHRAGIAAHWPFNTIYTNYRRNNMPSPYELLVSGQYVGGLTIFQAAGEYGVGLDFSLTANPPMWRMRTGVYNGAWHVDGYWIYHPTRNMCWQADNYMGPLRYWNEDGQANTPEDWEIFKFEWADETHNILRIKQGRSGAYVGLGGNLYNCTVGEAFPSQAAQFIVQFQ